MEPLKLLPNVGNQTAMVLYREVQRLRLSMLRATCNLEKDMEKGPEVCKL